jgi:aldose 1-epimerase
MKLPECERVAIDDRMIPTGKRSGFDDFSTKKMVGTTALDTCFQLATQTGSPKLVLTAPGRTLSVKAPAKQFPFFQVFTPPHRESIALEPMTCNVDALNNKQGLVSLDPDTNWKSTIEIQCA